MAEYKGVAGIGIEIDEDTFRKAGKLDLFKKLTEDECEIDQRVQEYLEENDIMSGEYKYSGNCMTGEMRHYIVATDPIVDVAQFFSELVENGFDFYDIEDDFKFIEDVLVY